MRRAVCVSIGLLVAWPALAQHVARDRDHDGVDDRVDNCPKEAGPADNHGCPVSDPQAVAIASGKLLIGARIDFVNSSVAPRATPVLDQIASLLLNHPEIAHIIVEGHTDATGEPDDNRRTSLARANAVRAYLINHSIAPERVMAVGYGQDRPLESNATAAGREKNRRIDFVIPEELPSVAGHE